MVWVVHRINWFKGWIGSRFELVQGMNWCKGWIGSRVELVQGLNWFKCWIGQSVELVQVSNWINCWIGSRFYLLVWGLNWFKFLIIIKDSIIVVEVKLLKGSNRYKSSTGLQLFKGWIFSRVESFKCWIGSSVELVELLIWFKVFFIGMRFEFI